MAYTTIPETNIELLTEDNTLVTSVEDYIHIACNFFRNLTYILQAWPKIIETTEKNTALFL